MKAARFSLALAALALAPPASAHEPPAPSPSTLVEEVEVIGRLPGPPMWRVSTPTSQIWFFAPPATGLPKGYHWDDRRIATALEGARELVTPPQTTFGLGAIVTVLVGLREPSGHTVRGDLPPDLRARWEQAARAVGRDPGHYDHWLPVLAAGFLQNDIAKRDGANRTGIGVQLMPLVRKSHVKVRSLASYSGKDMLKSLANTPDAAAQACLGYMADVALEPPSAFTEAGEAWAKGDFAPALALNRRGSVCVDATPALADLRNRAAADWAKGLKAELGKPGKVVVLADLDTMTRKGGLLDQMKAEGLEVIGPAY
jgi:uncharacterized protein YbaP (TraB family)